MTKEVVRRQCAECWEAATAYTKHRICLCHYEHSFPDEMVYDVKNRTRLDINFEVQR